MVVPTSLSLVLIALPRNRAPAMIATALRAIMRAYSADVAHSSRLGMSIR
jgi:hypothetical protein